MVHTIKDATTRYNPLGDVFYTPGYYGYHGNSIALKLLLSKLWCNWESGWVHIGTIATILVLLSKLLTFEVYHFTISGTLHGRLGCMSLFPLCTYMYGLREYTLLHVLTCMEGTLYYYNCRLVAVKEQGTVHILLLLSELGQSFNSHWYPQLFQKPIQFFLY